MKPAILFVVMSVMAFGLGGQLEQALAQQPSPQQGTAATTSPQPPRRGPTLRSGPPIGVTDTVGPLHIRGFSSVEALQQISRKANVVIGVEAILYKTDKPIIFDFPGGTVADLLNAFVAEAPDYRWQNDGGVIHVFRNGAHVPLADLMLNYPGASGKTRFDIWWGLNVLPEYRAWMRSSQCHPLGRRNPISFHYDKGPINIPAGQITLSQLLDQVATKSGDGFWAVLQSDPSDPVCRVSVIAWSL